MVAGSLDTGGIEAVVAALSRGLPRHGIQPTVVCASTGRTAYELQQQGVDVVHAPTARSLLEFLRTRQPDVVQLHRADRDLARAVWESGMAATPVFHAIETYLDATTWRELSRLVEDQPVAVAVSSSVRHFVSATLASSDPTLHVIVNGCQPPAGIGEVDRADARARIGGILGQELGDDTVVVSLARFSDQKNVPGLVDAFLHAARHDPGLRLIVAGEPANWLEVRRADALRRGHPDGARVHLLGTSDPAVLLTAADLFVLNSLAEGGPLAAVEAAAYGLPLVLSDVGFARQLVECDEVTGLVVQRANEVMTSRSLARARRARRQHNRLELSRAMLQMRNAGRSPVGVVPPAFSESAMVAAHGEVLRSVADRRRSPVTRSAARRD